MILEILIKGMIQKTVIEKLTKLSISSLKETKLLQETEMINIVADLITESEVIDFYGIGASHISLFLMPSTSS